MLKEWSDVPSNFHISDVHHITDVQFEKDPFERIFYWLKFKRYYKIVARYKQSGPTFTNSSSNDNTAEQADNPKVKVGKVGTDEQSPNSFHVSSLENLGAVNESTENEITAGTGNQIPHFSCEISPVSIKNVYESSATPTNDDAIVNEKSPEQNPFCDKSNKNNTSEVVTKPIIKQEPRLKRHNNIRLENKDDEQEEGEIMSTDEEQEEEELATDIPLEKDSQTLPSIRWRVKSEFTNNFSPYVSTPYQALSLPALPTNTPSSLHPEPLSDGVRCVHNGYKRKWKW